MWQAYLPLSVHTFNRTLVEDFPNTLTTHTSMPLLTSRKAPPIRDTNPTRQEGNMQTFSNVDHHVA